VNSRSIETGSGASFARRGSRILATATIAAMTIGAGLVMAPAASAAEGDGAIEGSVLVAGQPADGEISVYNSDFSFNENVSVVDGYYEMVDVPAGNDYSVSFYAANPADEYGYASASSSVYDYDLGEYIYLTVDADETETVDFDTKWNFTVDSDAEFPESAELGTTVEFTPGVVLNPGVEYSTQWYLDEVPVEGATGSTFAVSPDYAGQYLTVTQSATKAGYESYNWNGSFYIDGPEMEPGFPVIPQDISVGETISVTIDGEWTPKATSYTYDWYAYDESSTVNEEGDGGPFAHTKSIVVTPDLLGKTIAVNVTGKRSGYIPATRTSNPSNAVTGPKLSTSKPVVSGTAKIGSTLKASAPVWNETGVTTSYRWYATYPGTTYAYSIPGAVKSSYKVTGTWAGYKISVKVTGKKTNFSTTTVASALTKTVPYLKVTAATPKLSGTFKVGKTVKASAGSWKPSGMKFFYVWNLNGKPYTETVKGSFKLPKAAKGKKVTVTVTGYKAGYEYKSKTSKSSSKVK